MIKYIFILPALICFVFLFAVLAPEIHWMLENLTSFLPQAALGAFVCALIAPALKAYGPAVTLVCYAALFGYMSITAHPKQTELVNDEAVDYSVMQWNALYKNTDLSSFTAFILKEENAPDVLQIQEFAPGHMQNVKELSAIYPHYKLYPEATAASQGAAIFSKYPIVAHKGFVLEENGYEFVMTTIAQKEGREALGILSLHTKAPVSENWLKARNDSLQRILPQLRHLQDKAPHTILLGDLNLAPYSKTFKGFLGTAGLNASTALLKTETWPAFAPSWMRTQIDHVLVTPNIKSSAQVINNGFGSDHFPLKAMLTFN